MCLLIGGVGIFSVRKVSISERLFEIGVRKSMGAADKEIFVQFLVESVSLSVAGAAIGFALGMLVVKLIAGFFPAGLPGLQLRPPDLDGVRGGSEVVRGVVTVAQRRAA